MKIEELKESKIKFITTVLQNSFPSMQKEEMKINQMIEDLIQNV